MIESLIDQNIKLLTQNEPNEKSLAEECDYDATAPLNQLKSIPSTTVTVNKKQLDVPAFKVSIYLVSNQEFLNFVRDDGYKNDNYWSNAGKKWKKSTETKHPASWIQTDDGYDFKTNTQILKLPLSWPVEVNLFEALAFCAYLSAKTHTNISLPSEEMWHSLAHFCQVKDSKTLANINFQCYGSICPVNEFEHNNFYDVIGNVWQWTSTAVKQQNNDTHYNILKGASYASTSDESLINSRYALQAHLHHHTGFRYIEASEIQSRSVCDTTNTSVETINPKHQAVLDYILPLIKNRSKIICLGCKTGAIAGYLSSEFDKVVATDFNAHNVQLAKEKFPMDNIRFLQADSCNLKSHFCDYDLVLVTSSLVEMYNLKQFLYDIPNRLNPKGKLIIAIENLSQKDKELIESILCTKLTKLNTCLWEKK
ncbi:MAG: SUMF1/EgtB/PvdO family nonheme iron enzyme [Campylobacterota bacterium]|nr:SUMF1/EgtB/PvdO family nonheme iron enzyme [Campylobacterota bacterium]